MCERPEFHLSQRHRIHSKERGTKVMYAKMVGHALGPTGQVPRRGACQAERCAPRVKGYSVSYSILSA